VEGYRVAQGLYVHVPFCNRKCQYCDFHSVVADDDIVGPYFDAFQRELAFRADQARGKQFHTLFVGGGTPSVLECGRLEWLLNELFEHFQLAPGAEVTMEANPASLTRKKIETLAAYGVNRVSLGVQSFSDDLLRQIGRMHTANRVAQCITDLRDCGITNISLDLMFGLPSQTLTEWQDSLQRAVDCGVEHLSCYALIVEGDTPLHALQQRGELDLPDEEEEADMFQYAVDFLPQMGYEHYEISSFSRPGSACRHNLLYWTGQPYLALGSGAVGSWAGRRYLNAKDLSYYNACWHQGMEAVDEEEWPDRDQQMAEYMMTGMRLLQGVDAPSFQERFGATVTDVYGQVVKDLTDRGLVAWKEDRLQLTLTGLFLGNIVFAAWFPD